MRSVPWSCSAIGQFAVLVRTGYDAVGKTNQGGPCCWEGALSRGCNICATTVQR
jgi:hypothetical protein